MNNDVDIQKIVKKTVSWADINICRDKNTKANK